MSQVLLDSLTLLSATACALLLGTYSMKDVLDSVIGGDIFLGSPGKIADKYELSMYTKPWVGSTIRPLSMVWNIAGIIYILIKTLADEPIPDLPKVFFFSWSGAWISTICWVFLFDSESNVLAASLNFIVFIFFSQALYYGIYYWFEENEKKGNGKVFAFVVLEGLGVSTTWSFLAFAMSFALSIAYANSSDSEGAILSGFLSMEECSTIGLILNLFGFVLWWILDIANFGRKTDCILSPYIVFTIVSFSIASNNYTTHGGATVNNILSLASGILAVFALLTRNMAKTLFLDCYRSPVKLRKD